MSEPSMKQFRRVVRDETGLALEASDDYLLDRAIASVVEEEDYHDADQFMREYIANPTDDLTERLVTQFVADETYFFRDQHPFDVLGQQILPDLLESEREEPIRIWCAACSSGQEAYSIAFHLREQFPGRLGDKIQIVASDLSSELLEQAKAGRYSQLSVNRGLPARMLAKYFDRDGEKFQVKSEIRSQISFRRANLLEPLDLEGLFEVVFLRYLLAYYTDEARRRILDRVHAIMREGSYLILGGAETWGDIHAGFEMLRTESGRFYRRVPLESESGS